MFSTSTIFRKNFNRTEGILLILTAVLTTIASEIKVVPFNEETFRFGLGSITFFLLVLIWTPVSIVRTGLVTGLTVVCFRLFGEILVKDAQVLTSLKNILPVFLFYYLFSLGLHVMKIEKYKTMPLILGAWATIFEIVGNGTEQLVRHFLVHQTGLRLQDWSLISGVAFLRSYFAVGLYSSIIIAEQKKRMQEVLGVGSELYAETLYLQKSMNHIERITVSSYDLYRQLKKMELQPLSIQALHIAQEIHEVKKDSQRILSGLTKITVRKSDHHLLLSDVLNFVVSANEKYSELLKKDIMFHTSIRVDFETDQQIPLLALLNNLTANAVESIEGKGEVHMDVYEDVENTYFLIKDSGKGILKEDILLIFEPGYTTKFDEQGVAATGIGLSHVVEIVHTFEGEVKVESEVQCTTFLILIPTNNIRKRVDENCVIL